MGRAIPNIMYVLGSLGPGGAERRSLQLVQELRKRNPAFGFILYDMSGALGELDDAFVSAGCTIVKGRASLRGLLKFWRACRTHRVGILHSNVGAISGYFVLAGALAGIPTRICHFRSTHDHRAGAGSRLRRWLGIALINLLATRVVGVCDAARSFAPVRADRWITLYNGVPTTEAPLRRRPGGGNGPKRMLILGRIHPVKNYARSVAIFEALCSKAGAAFSLHFVGAGAAEDEHRLAGLVAESAYGSSIVIHGYSSDPLGHLRAADLLLLPSLWEGLPGSVLEALSVGTPVVASDLPGIREIARAVTGVTLVPLPASDDAWVNAIERALVEDRAAIAHSFSRSPFRFEGYVDKMAALWGLEAQSR